MGPNRATRAGKRSRRKRNEHPRSAGRTGIVEARGVTAYNCWANRLLFAASYLGLIVAALAAWASARPRAA
jgi:hypothetical protein